MTIKKQAKAPAFKVLEGATAINAAIKSLATRGKKFEQDLHVTAVSVLVHADKHGDITLAQKLVEALPGLTRKNALNDWLLAFGKFAYSTESKTLTYAKDKTSDIKQAQETPFWLFKVEAEYQPYDLQAALQQVWKRATAARDRGDNVPAELMAQLSTLVTQGGKPAKQPAAPAKATKQPKIMQADPLADLAV